MSIYIYIYIHVLVSQMQRTALTRVCLGPRYYIPLAQQYEIVNVNPGVVEALTVLMILEQIRFKKKT